MKTFTQKINAKRKQLTISKSLFQNEEGAIDLASIMVGIIVIGLIGGVIAATVFAVIPWTQDNAAKNQLESIHIAENAYYGFSSDVANNLPAGSKQNSFASSATLETAKLLTRNAKYCVVASPDGQAYTAYSLSAARKVWVSDNKKTPPTVFTGGSLPSECADLASAASAAGALSDISSPGKGDGTRAATDGTITGDGSGSYFPKSTAWLSAYGPVMSNTLPSSKLDLVGWSYNPTNRVVGVTFKTDGTFGGVGGSWNFMAHYDIQCYDTNTKTYHNSSGKILGSLDGKGIANQSTQGITCAFGAPDTQIPSQVYIRQATDQEWGEYYYRSFAYTMPGVSEGWVNSAVPQQ